MVNRKHVSGDIESPWAAVLIFIRNDAGIGAIYLGVQAWGETIMSQLTPITRSPVTKSNSATPTAKRK
jgi:hypothetical protein